MTGRRSRPASILRQVLFEKGEPGVREYRRERQAGDAPGDISENGAALKHEYDLPGSSNRWRATLSSRQRQAEPSRQRRGFTFACAGFGWALAAFALAPCTVAPALAETIDLRSERVALNPDDRAQTTIGGLDYLGGLVLRANDARFGGLSGLDVSPDGTRMTAVTDRGHWFTARLVHDDDGVLVDVADGAIQPILDATGRGVVGPWRDAEEIARLATGALMVSFERRHRVWAYAGDTALGSARPRALPEPPGLADAPLNNGIEALTELADGRLLAVTEKSYTGAGRVRGWLLSADGGSAARLSYAVAQGFFPTAFATLDGGDVLALERRYNVFYGAAARFMRIAAADIAPGVTLAGREIARLQAPLTVDNLEGLALRRGPDGATLVYVISDDNFKALQRTLLLQFRLRE